MDPKYFTILMALVAGVIVLALLICRVLLSYANLSVRVSKRYAQFKEKVDFFEHRFQMISTYALDYMNSMSPEGARAMYQLQQLLQTQQKLVEELEDWSNSTDTTVLSDADRVLIEMLAAPNGHVAVNDSEAPGSKLDHWEIRFEELLQLVGQDVAIASRKAKSLGVPRRRDRRPTSVSLQAAGIVSAEVDALRAVSEVKPDPKRPKKRSKPKRPN